MSEPLLGVHDLVKHFVLPRRRLFRPPDVLRAVDGVSFELQVGETLGVVGESGCGKTTMARLVLRLLDPTRGEIRLDGVDVLACSKSELRRLRREMQIVFQDPLSSLNPRMTVGVSVTEPSASMLLVGESSVWSWRSSCSRWSAWSLARKNHR